MSRILVLSVLVASLSTIVGCGASSGSARGASTAGNVSVGAVEERDESSWMPPEELALSISEAKEAPAPVKRRARGEAFRPNRESRPTSGAVHAATY
jgi:hypothetical protein